ncbi:unnamed protein product [Mytilus coruscus]|uniref:MEGF10_11 n=1 Tax=Mytilus coruscus TaxID=42192 RepID=A0A6J8DQ01_MYTCO|nr:unnamed protein product [Mytilus coruscus]
MHIYHIIDDNILADPNTNCYPYSEVMIESSSQKSKKSGTETACSYAQHTQQYQSLVAETLKMHHYKNIEYCCSDYEDINGTCTECKIGFISIKGKPCFHCPKNRFGERCLDRCNCNEIEERCDHVNGCVSKFEIGENTDDSTRTQEKDFPDTQTVLKLKWYVYCGGITGVILLVWGCFACVQFRRRRQTPNTAITNDENRILRVLGKRNQNASEQKKSMHIYHTIDDNILAESSIKKGQKSGTETACSNAQHAQQYQSLVPATMEMHHYE